MISQKQKITLHLTLFFEENKWSNGVAGICAKYSQNAAKETKTKTATMLPLKGIQNTTYWQLSEYYTHNIPRVGVANKRKFFNFSRDVIEKIGDKIMKFIGSKYVVLESDYTSLQNIPFFCDLIASIKVLWKITQWFRKSSFLFSLMETFLRRYIYDLTL